MDSRRLASVLDASWPWLFGGTVALTGSYAVYRIFVKNDAGTCFGAGHYLWLPFAIGLLFFVAAHLWLLCAVGFSIAARIPVHKVRLLLMLLAILPAYVPEWIWGLRS